MSTNIGTVEGLLRLRDEFSSVLSRASSQLAATGERMQQIGRGMSEVGGQMTRSITLPIVALGGVALKMSTDFNKAMANVASLIPGNIERVGQLKTAVQDLSVSVGKSTEDLSGGLYQAISAFGDTSEVVKILEINARAAAAGVAETTDAINLTSVVTKNYGDVSAEAVQKASDLALLTVRLGQTTFPELAAAMGKVTPIAKNMKQSQEELFAVFATATGVTGRAAEVSTQYQGVLNALLAPSEGLTQLIKKMGFASGEAMLQQLGLIGTLQTIVGTAEKSHRPIKDFIAQIEAVPLALALAGPQAENFKVKLAEMTKASGATDAAFKEQTQGVNAAGFAFEQAKAKATVLGQQLGDALAPVLLDLFKAVDPVVRLITRMVEQFAALSAPGRTVIVVIAGIAAAAGPAIYVLGQLITAWGSIISIAPKVVSAVASMNLAVYGVVAVAAVAVLAINGLIKKWGEASQAAIAYDVATGNLAGRALNFVRTVQAGKGTVSQTIFDQASKSAVELNARIWELEKSLPKLKADVKEGLNFNLQTGDTAPQRLKKAQDEIAQLNAAYAKLAHTLASAKVVADATGKSLDIKPPTAPLNDLGIVLAKVEKGAKELRDEFESLLGSQQTPREKLLADMARLNELIKQGVGSAKEAAVALKRMADEAARLDPFRGKSPLLDLTKLNADAVSKLRDIGAEADRVINNTTASLADEAHSLNVLEEAYAKVVQQFGAGSLQAKSVADELQRARDNARDLQGIEIDVRLISGDPGTQEDPLQRSRDDYARAVADIKRQNKEIQDSVVRTNKEKLRAQKETDRALLNLQAQFNAAQLAAIGDAIQSLTNILSDLGVFTSQNVQGLPAGAQDRRAEGRGQIASSIGGIAQNPYNVAAWWGLLNGIAKALTTQGGIHGTTTVGSTAGLASYGTFTWQGGQEITDHLNSLGTAITTAINGALDLLGGTIDALNVKVTQKGQGWRVSINDGFEYYFENLDEALNYAIRDGIKAATIQGLDPEVVQAMKGSTAKTFEQLFSDLDFGKWVADLNLDPVAAQIEETVKKFSDAMKRAILLGIDTQKISEAFALSLRDQRDQLLGIKIDPAEQLRRQIDAFNRQLQIIKAEEEAKRASLLVQRAQLLAEIGITRAEGVLGEEKIKGRIAILRAEGELAAAELEIANTMIAALKAVDAALASIDLILANLPPLITDAEALLALGRLGRGGGGGPTKKEREQGVKDFIHEKELSFLPELQQRLARLNEEYAEQLRNAGGNVELQRKLNELKKKELEMIGAGIKQDLIKPYLGRPGQQSDFARQMEEIQKAYDDARAVAHQTGVEIWKLNRAERERMRLLGLQAAASLGIFSARLTLEIEETAKSLDFLKMNAETLGLTAEQVAAIMAEVSTSKFLDIGEAMAKQLGDEKLLAEFAEMRYDIQKAQWRLEIEMLHEKGILLEDQYKRLMEILGRLPENLPGAGGANNHQALQDLMAQRIADNARAIADAANRWLESTKKLLDYQKSLALSNLSTLSPTDRLAEARRQYDEVLAAANRGDVGARERFQQIADQLLGEGRSAFASSEAYTTLFNQVQADLQRLISAPQPGTIRDGNVVYGAFGQAIGPVVGALQDTGPIAQRLGTSGPIVTTMTGGYDQTVNSIRGLHAGVRTGLEDVKNAIKDPANKDAALVSQLSRLADALESWLRRKPAA